MRNEKMSPSMRRWVVKGQTAGSCYVGRPSKFGNPFKIQSSLVEVPENEERKRGDVIRRYARWLRDNPELIEAAKKELVGLVLRCHCAPQRCHAEILVLVANGVMSIDEIIELHETEEV